MPTDYFTHIAALRLTPSNWRHTVTSCTTFLFDENKNL